MLNNWKQPADFHQLLDKLRAGEDDMVIIVSKNAWFAWFHVQMIHALFPNRKITFISRDDRVKRIAKQLGYRTFLSVQDVDQILPEGFEIARENITTLEYVQFHIRRFFHRLGFQAKEFIPKRVDIFTVKHSSWYMLVLGIIVILLIMIGIVSLTTPHATIVITPQINIQNAAKNVTFIPEDEVVEVSQIPIRQHIFSYSLEKKYAVNSYDQTSLKRAHWTIKIINSGIEPLNLRAQTQLVADTLVFRIPQRVQVPPARDSKPGEITLDIEADPIASDGSFVGKRWNIPANTTLVFPKLPPEDHEFIRVFSVDDFSGGDNDYKHMLLPEEYDSLEKIFREQVATEARDSIIHHFDNKAEYIPIPIADIVSTLDMTVSSSLSKWAYGDSVTFSGKWNFMIYLYHVPTLRKILVKSAEEHLLEKVESLADISETVQPDIIAVLSQVTDPFSIKATAQLSLQILYDFNSSAGQKTLQNILSDLLEADADRAQKTLLNHPYIKSVDVRLTPFWAKKLPNSLDKIYIKVKKMN